MGCFSFLCKECDKGILSSSFAGQKCHLFLLKDGEVVQKMEGEYDSYGRTFINETQREDVQHDLRKSHYWKDPTPEIALEEYWQKDGIDNPSNHGYWLRVCSLMSDSSSSDNGIAAYHDKCYSGQIPTTQSLSDPNQGWGDDDELLASVDDQEIE